MSGIKTIGVPKLMARIRVCRGRCKNGWHDVGRWYASYSFIDRMDGIDEWMVRMNRWYEQYG